MAYLLLLALIAFGVPLGVSLGKRVDSEVRAQAKSQAEVVAASAPELLEHSQKATLERLVTQSAQAQRGRVLVVDAQGRVVADSAGPSEVGADYASRPEVADALSGRTTQEVRHSSTLGEDLLATAVPILRSGKPIGAVRVTQSNSAVTHATHAAIFRLALLGGIVLLLGAVAGGLIARETSRPIGHLEQAAQQVEHGDLTAVAPVEGSSEQRALAHSFNSMTSRLARLLRSQQEFVADASHQLRTPLTGIRLQLEELRDGLPPEDPRVAELDAGLKEIDRLAAIVNELLILSRAGEREMPADQVDVATAVDEAVGRWRKAAGEAGIALAHEREADAGELPLCPPGLRPRARLADRERAAVLAGGLRGSGPHRPGSDRGARPGSRARAGRGGDRLRAVSSRTRRPPRGSRNGARSVDCSGARRRVGRQRDDREPRGRRGARDDRPPDQGSRCSRGGRVRMTASSLRWPAFAVIGLLVAIGVAVLATQMVSEKIGISSEPVTAGESLSPKRAEDKAKVAQRPTERTMPTPTSPAGSTATLESSGSAGTGESDGGRQESADKPSRGTLSPAPAGSTPSPEQGDD